MRKIDLTNFQVATSETARQINRRITLNFLRHHQPMSRADLSRRSGLQRSTVSAIVDQLIEEGWVTEGAIGRLPRGRRPQVPAPQRRAHRHRRRQPPARDDDRRPGERRRAVRGTAVVPDAGRTRRISSATWRGRSRACGRRIRSMVCEGVGVSLPGGSTKPDGSCSRRISAGATSTCKQMLEAATGLPVNRRECRQCLRARRAVVRPARRAPPSPRCRDRVGRHRRRRAAERTARPRRQRDGRRVRPHDARRKRARRAVAASAGAGSDTRPTRRPSTTTRAAVRPDAGQSPPGLRFEDVLRLADDRRPSRHRDTRAHGARFSAPGSPRSSPASPRRSSSSSAK